MVRIWRPQSREESEISKSALGEDISGDVTVVISGDKLDSNITSIGCQIAKGVSRKVHLLHVVEVPRALPLKAVPAQESERADQLLNAARYVADQVRCNAVFEVVYARDAGIAIVDEVKDYHCALLIIGQVLQKQPKSINKTVSYILANAHCRVWLVTEPLSEPLVQPGQPERSPLTPWCLTKMEEERNVAGARSTFGEQKPPCCLCCFNTS